MVGLGNFTQPGLARIQVALTGPGPALYSAIYSTIQARG
jgi:hypothetical protein